MNGSQPASDVEKQNRRFTAKLFALGARNGVEDLHAGGLFDDSQAPLFNGLMRARIYEALEALGAGTEAASDWLIEHSDLEQDDALLGAIPPAADRAIEEFATAIELPAEQREQLTGAARAGIVEAIEVYNGALDGDETAQRQFGLLAAMVPTYWENPEVAPGFLAALGIDRS